MTKFNFSKLKRPRRKPSTITSGELIARTGGNPGPVCTLFPPEQREPSQIGADADHVSGHHSRTSLREANIARQAEWDGDDKITPAYRGNEMAGEVGEACNVIKKLERERFGIAGSRATVSDLADELADVVICADLIAMQYGVDLEAAVVRKFNATSGKVGLKTRLQP